jgi:glycosyltransferase involved in cell wall biosynthesis
LGGAEFHLKELSEGLVNRGHEVTVLTANVRSYGDVGRCKVGDLPRTEVIKGVRIIRFQPDGGLPGRGLAKCLQLRGGSRFLRLLFGHEGLEMLAYHPRIFSVIPRILGSDADVVMSMNWHWSPAFHTYLARKLKRFTLVGIPLFHTAAAWCQAGIYRWMLTQCDAVIANTQYEADFIRARARTKVEVAGVGVRAEEFRMRNGDQIRARYGLGRHPIVGFIGRQSADKGAAVLIEAMKIVWKWSHEARLIIAGSRSKEPNEVDDKIDGLTAFERARIVRIDEFPEKEKASLFDAFDVFALPSEEESFGIAYLEAWMCGKPVIGARIGSTRCVIDEGVDGLLTDHRNPHDLAEKILELLSDSAKRERLGRNGHTKTMARHTWDKVTDKVEKVYYELGAMKGKASPYGLTRFSGTLSL